MYDSLSHRDFFCYFLLATSLTHTLRLLTQQLLFLVHPNTDIETIPSDFRALIAALPQHIANLNALNRKVVLVSACLAIVA